MPMLLLMGLALLHINLPRTSGSTFYVSQANDTGQVGSWSWAINQARLAPEPEIRISVPQVYVAASFLDNALDIEGLHIDGSLTLTDCANVIFPEDNLQMFNVSADNIYIRCLTFYHTGVQLAPASNVRLLGVLVEGSRHNLNYVSVLSVLGVGVQVRGQNHVFEFLNISQSLGTGLEVMGTGHYFADHRIRNGVGHGIELNCHNTTFQSLAVISNDGDGLRIVNSTNILVDSYVSSERNNTWFSFNLGLQLNVLASARNIQVSNSILIGAPGVHIAGVNVSLSTSYVNVKKELDFFWFVSSEVGIHVTASAVDTRIVNVIVCSIFGVLVSGRHTVLQGVHIGGTLDDEGTFLNFNMETGLVIEATAHDVVVRDLYDGYGSSLIIARFAVISSGTDVDLTASALYSNFRSGRADNVLLRVSGGTLRYGSMARYGALAAMASLAQDNQLPILFSIVIEANAQLVNITRVNARASYCNLNVSNTGTFVRVEPHTHPAASRFISDVILGSVDCVLDLRGPAVVTNIHHDPVCVLLPSAIRVVNSTMPEPVIIENIGISLSQIQVLNSSNVRLNDINPQSVEGQLGGALLLGDDPLIFIRDSHNVTLTNTYLFVDASQTAPRRRRWGGVVLGQKDEHGLLKRGYSQSPVVIVRNSVSTTISDCTVISSMAQAPLFWLVDVDDCVLQSNVISNSSDSDPLPSSHFSALGVDGNSTNVIVVNNTLAYGSPLVALWSARGVFVQGNSLLGGDRLDGIVVESAVEHVQIGLPPNGSTALWDTMASDWGANPNMFSSCVRGVVVKGSDVAIHSNFLQWAWVGVEVAATANRVAIGGATPLGNCFQDCRIALQSSGSDVVFASNVVLRYDATHEYPMTVLLLPTTSDGLSLNIPTASGPWTQPSVSTSAFVLGRGDPVVTSFDGAMVRTWSDQGVSTANQLLVTRWITLSMDSLYPDLTSVLPQFSFVTSIPANVEATVAGRFGLAINLLLTSTYPIGIPLAANMKVASFYRVANGQYEGATSGPVAVTLVSSLLPTEGSSSTTTTITAPNSTNLPVVTTERSLPTVPVNGTQMSVTINTQTLGITDVLTPVIIVFIINGSSSLVTEPITLFETDATVTSTTMPTTTTSTSVSTLNFTTPVPSTTAGTALVQGAKAPLAPGLVVGLAVAVLVALTLIGVFLYRRRRTARGNKAMLPPEVALAAQKRVAELLGFGPSKLAPLQDAMRPLIWDAADVTLESAIGAGNFGIVYKGKLRGRDEWLAIKQPHSENPDELDLVSKDLLVEAYLLLYAGEHPHVVTLYGCVAMTGGLVAMVMEMAPHGDLRMLLRQGAKGQSLTVFDKMEAVAQLAQGLSHLHAKHIVHRDVACRNTLVMSLQPLRIAISDLGLARTVREQVYYKQTSKVALPFAWMAPESLVHRRFSPASDAWSLGMTAWEIFANGQRPWEGKGPEAIMLALQRGERPVLQADMPPQLQRVWEREPIKRGPIDAFNLRSERAAAIPVWDVDASALVESQL
ncbi:uncharacterized protein MONBRDRAFT_28694 [Monosiga brevicollis MX1]|uniref:Protein kinase domain-containing protein n=1 Tax=Monosiga brevicollis TaxID=81824 RepID=A9V8X4_MONBE|nr:uncharacterized protein MONBRDRAFT_28694 [Monosiga brevicollis MX1]EDQ85950.1 predicted protein [Monosiga brevicollis MX1]|eukprot:XP_001749144.1 hypothetical protein [Monosiga brevicollis MX1]